MTANRITKSQQRTIDGISRAGIDVQVVGRDADGTITVTASSGNRVITSTIGIRGGRQVTR